MHVYSLDDLVLGLCSTSTDNEGVTRAENGDGVFADITEPHVGQSASAWEVSVKLKVMAVDYKPSLRYCATYPSSGHPRGIWHQ